MAIFWFLKLSDHGQRVEFADKLALLDFCPLGHERFDGRAPLDPAEHQPGSGRLHDPLRDDGETEVAWLDRVDRHLVDPGGLSLALGTGPALRGPALDQQVDAQSRRTQHEHRRSNLQPLDQAHGSEYPLRKERGRPRNDRPAGGKLNRSAGRRIDQRGGNGHTRLLEPRCRGQQPDVRGKTPAPEPVTKPLPPS